MKALWKSIAAMSLFVLGACVPVYYQTPLQGGSSPGDVRAYSGMIEWAKQTPGGKSYESRRVWVWQQGRWVEQSTYWESGSYQGSPPPYSGYGYIPYGSGGCCTYSPPTQYYYRY